MTSLTIAAAADGILAVLSECDSECVMSGEIRQTVSESLTSQAAQTIDDSNIPKEREGWRSRKRVMGISASI
jgi:hypothetical protein